MGLQAWRQNPLLQVCTVKFKKMDQHPDRVMAENVALAHTNNIRPAYNTLPALAGMEVSMALVAAEAAAMFLPWKLLRKPVVV